MGKPGAPREKRQGKAFKSLAAASIPSDFCCFVFIGNFWLPPLLLWQSKNRVSFNPTIRPLFSTANSDYFANFVNHVDLGVMDILACRFLLSIPVDFFTISNFDNFINSSKFPQIVPLPILRDFFFILQENNTVLKAVVSWEMSITFFWLLLYIVSDTSNSLFHCYGSQDIV